MRFVVRVDIPVVNNEEIIKDKTDGHSVFCGDRGEQTTSKNDDVGFGHSIDTTVEG